ncbi:MAG: hypothetical protein VX583_01665 [Bdellovibrionota bacterium]|nr:hypothetical protein [Pseudobdellovibrionaceae bacterium]|tara:strand:+ start:23490 stop:23849 length:360 start_codon:yes stop_codon:yes gene_type:complete
MNKSVLLIVFLLTTSSFALECGFYSCGYSKCDSNDKNRKLEMTLEEGENHLKYRSPQSDRQNPLFVVLSSKDSSFEIKVRQHFQTHIINVPYPQNGSVARYVYNDSMGGKVADYAIECK